jgi:hypothetical protein
MYLVVDQFIESTETKRVCVNGHEHWQDKFCSQCGTMFTKKQFPTKERLSCYEAAEEFGFSEDSFWNVDRGDEPHIWVANGGSLINPDDGEHAIEINPDTIAAAVAVFREEYATVLALLEKNGVEYEILYGSVIYYS